MKKYIKNIILRIPFFRDLYDFKSSVTNRISMTKYLKFKIIGLRGVYWPVNEKSEVTHPLNIFVGINSNAATRPGCYLQGNGGIYIGNYVHLASNIGIISSNHDLNNQKEHVNKEVYIDDYCWIGMNAVILPGVHLGKRTIVGAGSVVTKSFPEGFCVIAGNPAKIIKKLNPNDFVPTQFRTEYYGYINKDKFKLYAQKHLKGHKYMAEINAINQRLSNRE